MCVGEFDEYVGEKRVRRERSPLGRCEWVFPMMFQKHRSEKEGSVDCQKLQLKETEEVAGVGKAPALPSPSLSIY